MDGGKRLAALLLLTTAKKYIHVEEQTPRKRGIT